MDPMPPPFDETCIDWGDEENPMPEPFGEEGDGETFAQMDARIHAEMAADWQD